jgi:hypothetical protein
MIRVAARAAAFLLLCLPFPIALGKPLDIARGEQDKQEFELKWGLSKDLAADYTVSEIKGGKPVPLKDKSFIIYGSELLADGTSSLMVNSYEDIGPFFLFLLPKGKVKAGAKWMFETTLFKDARLALTPMHCYKELNFAGAFHVRKIEKVQDRECASIEGVFQYFEVKLDAQGRKKQMPQPMGTLRVNQWLSLANTELVRGTWELKGKGQEYKGMKQGEEPKQNSVDIAHAIELKKDYLKLELKEQFQPIADAIKKGVAGIRKMQEKNGAFVDRGGSFARDFPVGSTALALMALLHSGVKADDPAVKAGFQFAQAQPFKKTYDVSTLLMLLETKYLPLEQIQDVQDLTEEKAREAIQKAITKDDRALAERCAKWLIEKQTKLGTWGYPDEDDYYDHSNTQYALLGLKSAARMGVAVPAATWTRAANHWLDTQRISGKKTALKLEGYEGQEILLGESKTDETFQPGPWGYLVKKPEAAAGMITDEGYGSMTCAGLTSLIIIESELAAQKALDDALRKKIDTAMKQGLAWIQENYSIRGATPPAGFWSIFYFYYLYSLERVGVLYGIQRIGGHHWYLEGAVLLCRSQREDGSWNSYDEIPVLDTAFALLFLKKATVRVSTGQIKKP